MIESDKFVVMDGTLPVNTLQKQMRQIVKSRIDLSRFAPKKSARRASMKPPRNRAGKTTTRRKGIHTRARRPRNYGLPLPGVHDEEFGGSLIVIEGMDGSGRSTQISLLTEWLESEGFAVETMGLRRSGLVAKDIDALLAENTITRMTLTLMYATDFYDQLEHRIIPALRSDFVVLADRYFYTLIARAAARGIQRDYLQRLIRNGVAPRSYVLAERPPRGGVRAGVSQIARHQLLGVRARPFAFGRFIPIVHYVSGKNQKRI